MSSTQPRSVRNLAFNAEIIAYDYNYPERVRNQRLGFREFVGPPIFYSDAVLQEHRSPPATPSEAELLLREAPKVGLWVGMRPLNAVYLNGQLPRMLRRESVNKNSGFATIEYHLDSLRVIAHVASPDDSVAYYCLANSEEGLCGAYPVASERVFFFDEYRDDAVTGVNERITKWTQKVMEAYKAEDTGTVSRFKSLDTDEEDELKIGTNNSRPQLRLSEVLEPQRYTMLHKLASAIEVLTVKECDVSIQQFYVFAPDLKERKYQTQEFRQLSVELVKSKLFLGERMLRAVVTVSIEEQRRRNTRQAPVQNTNKLMQDAMGPPTKRTKAYSDSNRRYYNAEVDKIRKLVDAANDLLNSASNGGDSEMASILQPELMRREARLQLVEKRRDESLRQSELEDEAHSTVCPDDLERPLKRSRLYT